MGLGLDQRLEAGTTMKGIVALLVEGLNFSVSKARHL